MHLIDGAGHVNNQFVSEDVATGRPPTEITNDWMNAIQNEIANFILSAGMNLIKSNNTQLRDGTIHYAGKVWNIVANQEVLAAVPLPLPEGTRILVTSYYGPYQAAIVTMTSGAWIATPTPLNVFELYETIYDNHGYYWFSNAWNLFDVTAMQVEEATETEQGIIKLATWAEVLAGSLATLAMRPKHMQDYMDMMFVGMIEDFSGTTPPLVWVPAAGQLISRSERPKLWEFAQQSGNIIADSSWSTNTGKYSTGNGSTTFRVPDLRGEFRRGWDNGRGVDPGRAFGGPQSGAIPNITGRLTGIFSGQGYLGVSSFDASGAFGGYSIGNVRTASPAGNAYPSYGIDFDASRSVPTAQEVRVRNVAYLTCIYAGTPA